MKKVLFLLLLLCMFSCREQAQEDVKVSNGAVEVQLLFEHDGCKVYRFYDSRWIYYTDCRGKTDASYYQSHGKNGGHTEHLEVETN